MLKSGYFDNGKFYTVKFVNGQCVVAVSYDENPELESVLFKGHLQDCLKFVEDESVRIKIALAF